MFKRILLGVVLILVAVPAAGIGYLYFRSPAMSPAASIKVPMTPERIARGKMLFETVMDCDGCHSERDFTRIGGPVIISGRGRGVVLSSFIQGLPGVVAPSNITPDPETGLGTWTDGEKIRAIREGVGRDGRALFPMMPYTSYRHMSDEDVESLVAYLNTLPPVRNPVPRTSLNFPVNLFIKSAPKPVGSVPPPDRTDRLQYGEYLTVLAGCGQCHTPAEKGRPIAGKEFAGGEVFASTFGTVRSANITPDLETGIGKWSEDFFLKKFADYLDYDRNGPPKASGPEQFTVMPWLTFSRMQPEDLRAIYTYLRTLKPVKNYVEMHPGVPNQTVP